MTVRAYEGVLELGGVMAPSSATARSSANRRIKPSSFAHRASPCVWDEGPADEGVRASTENDAWVREHPAGGATVPRQAG